MATFEDAVTRLPDYEQKHVRELAENALFMQRKLRESRQELEYQQLAIPYDNGGGQEGVRKNPAFDAYEALMRTYQSVISQLHELLGIESSGVATKQESSLKIMRGKFSKSA